MMRSVRILLLVLPGVLLAATGTVSLTVEFAPGDFVFDKVNGFDVVALPGEYTTSVPGEPCLPLAVRNLVIPPDAEVVGIAVTDISTTVLPGEYDIHPCQRPRAFSLPAPGFVGPDDRTYSSDRTYPAEVVSFTRSGCLGGFRIAGVRVCPLRYVPAERRLELATRVRVEVRYERDRHELLSLDESQVRLMAGVAERLVANPDQVSRFAPRTRAADDWTTDMMVVTSSSLAGDFAPFAEWKTRNGIRTVVVRTDSIYSTYPGRDNQEKIRNCVIDYWQHHGLKWLLVGGDEPVVPVRLGRQVCEGNVGDIATDFYYADLQGSWDSNQNNLFGEMGDSMDLFHDVFVGRAPVDGPAAVANFFAKCTTYAAHPDTAYLKSLLFGSTMLFPPFHGRVINRMIADLFPSGWRFVHLEDPPSSAFRDSMSAGCQLGHVAAHGSQSSFSVMSISQISGLSNGHRKLNFLNSIACNSGWFDGDDCIAESLVNCRNGGCVANMFNSRYGFGYPPGFGPSEMLDLQFYRHFVNGDAFQFGTLCAMSKDHFQSLTAGQEVWRWCVYELNLFGDPSLQVWSERPQELAVSPPGAVMVGTQVVRFDVADGFGPVAGARVCALKGNETWARGWTNSAGWVDLAVSPTSTGNLEFTVNAHDFYPYRGTVSVSGSSSDPALVFDGLRIDDSDGNGRLDPGETADFYLTLANPGATAATGVSAKLRTLSAGLTFVDSLSSFGTIGVGNAVEGDAFRVTANGAMAGGTVVELLAACTATEGYWEPFFTTVVGEPGPPKGLWFDHDTGEVILSVTALGSIGTLGPYCEGSGMKYPRDATYGSLYFASLVCGNGPGYVVDRWYGQPTSTFDTDWHPVDTLHPVVPPFAADEEYEARIDDGNHPSPKGLVVTQWSGAVGDPGYRDFVIINYTLENQGASPLNDLHVGIFSDFDVNNETDNRVFSDAGRRLTYMDDGTGFDPCMGVKLLKPTTAANLSAIDHAVYVQPGGMMTEAVKDSFLRGAISASNSNRTANWSCMVSAGPFNLAPGARTQVAFAFVGAESQSGMLAHADSVQSWYDSEMPAGVTYLKHTVDDAPPGGNGDGIINPGEEINLPLWVMNRTDGDALGVRGILRRTSTDTLVTVADSTRHFGTVAAGDSAFTGSGGYRFRVAAACTNGYTLPVVLACVDTSDSVCISYPRLVVGAPQLVYDGVVCWDPRPGGNNNGKLDPGDEAGIALGLRNVGLGNAAGVTALFRSGDSRLVVLDSLGGYGNVPAGSTAYNTTDRYRVAADAGIPRETVIPCTLHVTGTDYAVTRIVRLDIGALTSGDPVPDGPRQPPRYYAYEDVDTFYVACPEFDWYEINGLGTIVSYPHNDDVIVVDLPSGFGPFYYYGQRYDQVSVSADGWIAPGNYTTPDYSNDELPGTQAPPGVICPNWDDLYPGYQSSGHVYCFHDEANHRFVIEYDSVCYYEPRAARDKFQVFIYDTTQAGPTGDNDIVVQYLTANRYSSSTIGLQDPTRTIAIQCLFDGSYHRASVPISAGRAIRFTTDSMITGVTGPRQSRMLRLAIHAAPNPVRENGLIRLTLPQAGMVKLTVHDITGRVVRRLVDAGLDRGVHSFVWDRKDDAGRRVGAGVYLYRAETGVGNLTRKAVVVH